MTPTSIRTALTLVISAAFLALPDGLSAQACSIYYSIEDGVRLEYTLYDKKDKVEGTQWQEFSDVRETANGLDVTVEMGMIDAKGKEAFRTTYGMSCDGNIIRIDFESLLNAQMLAQQEGMEVEITGTDLELPNQLEVGMELPDANVQMKMNMGAMNMNMEANTTDRRVEKMETVDTPAGSFECYVIYSNTQSKMMMVNKSFPNRVWLAKGVGMVKSESYNSKGKLLSRMVLSKVSD